MYKKQTYTVKVGDLFGDYTEVKSGLSQEDAEKLEKKLDEEFGYFSTILIIPDKQRTTIVSINKKNELIAKYMGLKKSPEDIQGFALGDLGPLYISSFSRHDYLQYHKDYNWIMKVVEKLEKEGHPVYIKTGMCTIKWSDNSVKNEELVIDQYSDSKNEAIFNAVYLFVKYLLKE